MTHKSIDVEAAKLLGYAHCIKYQALPIRRDKNHLWVALVEPHNTTKLADLADITGMHIVPVMWHAERIRIHTEQLMAPEALNHIASQFIVDEQLRYNTGLNSTETLEEISSAPAVRLIDSLIESGIANRASDIHIEPFGKQMRTRCRIDGHLHTYSNVDISLHASVISRLKIMGGMDISEKRRPQDGRFSLSLKGKKIEFRLSTLPTVFGEKAVIRLLYDHSSRLKKTELGFFEDDLAQLTTLFNKPYGAIIMTGPTGSGKSTTLNSFMAELNHDSVNIVTVEDPVENPIVGINHTNVERAADVNFTSVLRHVLRQDPDIIMIGEIRDEETADIAIRAAITGHLVLSTLHTNDAAGVIERILDMKIEPYLASAALIGVVSQRLVRRICTHCRMPATLLLHHAVQLNLTEISQVFEGSGCDSCSGTGYKGRLAVYEYIIMNDEMRRSMSTQPYQFAETLRGKSTFKATAIRHLLAGHTTVQEVLQILG